MSYRKNRNEILDKIIINESLNEVLFSGSQEMPSQLHVGGKGLSLKFELTSEDILYRLCRQKGIDFYDLVHSFEWFDNGNKIYVVSKQFGADLKLLEEMPHEKIIESFKNHSEHFKFLFYPFSGKEIYFLSYFEQAPSMPYYGKINIKKIAQKGRGFDEDGCMGSLYRIALHKMDHRF